MVGLGSHLPGILYTEAIIWATQVYRTNGRNFQKMADLIGKDVYYVNFLILMFFTLFEVAAVFFETIPGTDIVITRTAVWGVLIVVGIIKGYGIAAFFMRERRPVHLYKNGIIPCCFRSIDALGNWTIKSSRN